MKPSEMSNDELADEIMSFATTIFGPLNVPDELSEAAARLRNSIPKQALRSAYEEGWYDGAISVSGQRMTALHDVLLSEYWAASDARTALGINDTEGGVR